MNFKYFIAVVALLIFIVACNNQSNKQSETVTPEEWTGNVAYRWGKVTLEATGRDTDRFRPRPTVTSRMLGLIWTSVFDAWTRYDEKAIPVYLTGVERQAEAERTERNKEIAISYAAFRACSEFYFSDSAYFREVMVELGLNPDDQSLDPNTPVGIGNLAAKAVIEQRMNDGSNQLGDMEGSSGEPYSDYTGYNPVNSADELKDVIRWQPKYFSDGKGGQFAPGCLTPQWGNVKPLLLDSASQHRSPAPPAIGSEQLKNEVKEVVDMQANLTDYQMALVEFMRDGPSSVQQAGHWLIFAQHVSERDKHTLDQDVKMYFLVEAVAMDAFIACWETKMYYDYARPYALVHDYYQGEIIKGWTGKGNEFAEMDGSKWRPYSPETFLCPPFPSYVSGHSTVSGGCAEALKRFKGSDYFDHSVKRVPGALTHPEALGDTVTLHFETFTDAAEQAGISRVLGGYHIQVDNVEGLILGRKVAATVWEKYLYHIGEANQ
jgi:hypothetical protein